MKRHTVHETNGLMREEKDELYILSRSVHKVNFIDVDEKYLCNDCLLESADGEGTQNNAQMIIILSSGSKLLGYPVRERSQSPRSEGN
jgi:hypothetical protein